MDLELKKSFDTLSQAMMNLTTQVTNLRGSIGGGGGGGGGGAAGMAGGRTASSTAAAQAQREIDELEEQLKRSNSGFKSLAKSAKTFSVELPKALEEYKDALAEATPDADKINSASRKLTAAIANSSDSVDALNDEADKLSFYVSRFGKGLEAHRLVKSTKHLSSAMGQRARVDSLIAANQIRLHTQVQRGTLEYGQMIDNMSGSLSGLDASTLKALNLIDESTGQFRDDLESYNFADARIRLGQAQTQIAETIAKLGASDFGELTSRVNLPDEAGGKEARNEVAKLAMMLESSGLLNLGDKSLFTVNAAGEKVVDEGKLLEVTRANSVELSELLGRLRSFDSQVARSTKLLDQEADVRNDIVKNWKQMLVDGTAVQNMFGRLAEPATLLGGLYKLREGFKKLYEEITSFNIAQVPMSFKDVYLESFKLGMSLGDTTKFLQENKRMVATFGAELPKVTSATKETFSKFGYSMAQAAEAVGPAREAFTAMGVNAKDGDAFNQQMNGMMKSFRQISGIVNITAAEYARLNAELFNSSDVLGEMIGMDSQRSAAYGKDLETLRNRYVQLGLTTDQATELMKQQAAQARKPVRERFRQAAMQMALGQQAGLSQEEVQRRFRLQTKGFTTAEEKAELAALDAKLAKAVETSRLQGYGPTGEGAGGFIMDRLIEATGYSDELGKSLAKNEKANNQFSNEMAELAGKLGMGSEAVADVQNIANTIGSALQSGLGVAATGAGLSLLFLAAKAGKLAGMMNLLSAAIAKVAGQAGVAPIPDMSTPGGKGGKGGKGAALKKWGGRLGATAVLGGLAYSMMDSEAEKAEAEAKDEPIGMLESITQGALTGGSIGAFGGVPGALAGAAAGAVGGLGYSLYDRMGRNKPEAAAKMQSAAEAAGGLKIVSPAGNVAYSAVKPSAIQAPNALLVQAEKAESDEQQSGTDLNSKIITSDPEAHSYLARMAETMDKVAELTEQLVDKDVAVISPTSTMRNSNAAQARQLTRQQAFISGRA